MLRDVFDRVPGTGRWMTVLLADGNIGIGGDPAALLRRAGELLAPRAGPWSSSSRPARRCAASTSGCATRGWPAPWFPWAYVGADDIGDVARDAGFGEVETWTVDGRWFAEIRRRVSGRAAVSG